MEGESRRGGGEGADTMVYMNTVGVMEELLEKLKLLDYESEFCKKMNLRPFSR